MAGGEAPKGGSGSRSPRLAGSSLRDPAEPEAAPLERGLIVPPFAERLNEIGDGRTVNLGLYVVPRRPRAERGVEHLSLRVAFMTLVVATPVAEVDATDEGEILIVAAGVQEQHQLLVVRPAAPDPRVQQDSAGTIHDAGKIAGLPFVETEDPRVGAPQEPSDLDASARETGEQSAEARTAWAKKLIVVPPPIGEQHLVPDTERRETTDEPREVRGPVDQRLDMVADGPGEIRHPPWLMAVAGLPRSSAERNHSDAPCIRLACERCAGRRQELPA